MWLENGDSFGSGSWYGDVLDAAVHGDSISVVVPRLGSSGETNRFC